MSWFIKQDSLFDKVSNEIGYFLPTATPNERTRIKNGDELIDLIGELVTDYDEGKTPLKSVFNRLSKIVDKDANYKKGWTKTREGELLNGQDQVIFFFVSSDLILAKIIMHLPEAYSSAQELLNNLSSTNRQKTKKIYDQICDFYDKICTD